MRKYLHCKSVRNSAADAMFEAVSRFCMERALARLVVSVMEIIIASVLWQGFQHSKLKLDIASIKNIVQFAPLAPPAPRVQEQTILRIYR